jgi:hypothetical protein
MKKIINYSIGLIFIIPGLFILFSRIGIFNITEVINFSTVFKNYWPFLIFVLPGLYIHLLFFVSDRKNPAMLIVAGSSVFIGIIMQISYTFSIWSKLWPGFILSFGLGLLEYYCFSKKEKIVLFGVIIISGFSAILFSKVLRNFYLGEYIIAIVLIILGVVMILGNSSKISQEK